MIFKLNLSLLHILAFRRQIVNTKPSKFVYTLNRYKNRIEYFYQLKLSENGL